MSPSQSIADLTNQMKQYAQNYTQSGAGKDLTVTPDALKRYTDAIAAYRTALTEHRQYASYLTNYGNVGDFPSAQKTKSDLIADANEGFQNSLGQVITYLHEAENAISAVLNHIHSHDQNS